MSGRMYLPPEGALEARVVDLFGSITFGTTGSISTSSGKGIASVARNSAGNITVTLSDSYNALLWAGATVLDTNNSSSATYATSARVYSEDVSNSTTPTVILQGYAFDDGAAADFASGAKLLVHLKLRNSSIT